MPSEYLTETNQSSRTEIKTFPRLSADKGAVSNKKPHMSIIKPKIIDFTCCIFVNRAASAREIEILLFSSIFEHFFAGYNPS
jgi:hypothetical protein